MDANSPELQTTNRGDYMATKKASYVMRKGSDGRNYYDPKFKAGLCADIRAGNYKNVQQAAVAFDLQPSMVGNWMRATQPPKRGERKTVKAGTTEPRRSRRTAATTLPGVLAQFKGKSADEIAQVVKEHSIKGRAGTTSRCPMALLLHSMDTGNFVIGRKYIARKSGDVIEKVRTPENVAEFVAKFDSGGYPELMAPPPRCVARPPIRKRKPKLGQVGGGNTRGPIVHHLAKLVDRFSRA